MPAPTEHKCCNGGNCSQTQTSASLQEWDLTYWTSTDPSQCPLCKNFSGWITDTLVRWSEQGRVRTYTFSHSNRDAIEQDCSEATAIIVALADTWSHHLRSTHPGESMIGMRSGMTRDPFLWYLKFFRQ